MAGEYGDAGRHPAGPRERRVGGLVPRLCAVFVPPSVLRHTLTIATMFCSFGDDVDDDLQGASKVYDMAKPKIMEAKEKLMGGGGKAD